MNDSYVRTAQAVQQEDAALEEVPERAAMLEAMRRGESSPPLILLLDNDKINRMFLSSFSIKITFKMNFSALFALKI